MEGLTVFSGQDMTFHVVSTVYTVITFLVVVAWTLKMGFGWSKSSARSDEEWAKETGRRWPDMRPLDETILVGCGVDPALVDETLKFLREQGISTVGSLVGAYGHQDGVAQLIADGLLRGTAGALMVFIERVQKEAEQTVSSVNLLSAPKFEESFKALSTTDEFDFVKPVQFDEMLQTVVRSMKAKAERGINFVVCTGPMGVGKTRTGKELLKSAREKNSAWKLGYLSSAAKFPVQHNELALEDLERCDQVLAWALFKTFLPDAELATYAISLASVAAKIKLDLGGDKLLLQVDEFSHNPLGVRMLLRACSHLRVSTSIPLKIVVVVTGVQSLMNVTALPAGSRYNVTTYPLAPLSEKENAERIRLSFMRRIGMTNWKAFEQCARLQNLITDCGGFPASLEYLSEGILELPAFYLDNLRASGHLDISQARELYDTLLQDIRARYSESRWANVFLSSGESKRDRMFDRTQGILKRVLLDAITASGVRRDVAIEPLHDSKITYAIIETGGLVSLKRKDGASEEFYEVSMPLLAASCLNEYLQAIDGDVLKNPFEYGFEVHEELALVGLQANLRRMAAASVKTCKLSDLRPGALLIGNDIGQLLIDVPESCDLFRVGTLFGDNDEEAEVDLCTGLQGDGPPPPPQNPGTMLMAAVGQKAVDGALLLEGSMSGTKCVVLLLSQSKWSQLFFPGSAKASTTKIQKQPANDIIETLSRMKDQVIRAWLGDILLPVFVVYDVFSDRPKGPMLRSKDIRMPHPHCAVAITTEDSIEAVVGPVLGVRGRLKRIAEDEGASKKKSQRSNLEFGAA